MAYNEEDYYWGLKKSYGPEGYFWVCRWKLYNDSERCYKSYDECSLEAKIRNLSLFIKRGMADNIVFDNRHKVPEEYKKMCGAAFDDIYAPTYRRWYQGQINHLKREIKKRIK